jgi:hypothetical protein
MGTDSAVSNALRAVALRFGAWPMPEWWNPGWRNA